MNEQYRDNHYVPIWFQRRFLPGSGEKKFFYLDLDPEMVTGNDGNVRSRKELNRWGPRFCFSERDLYTTWFGELFSTEIEQKFFGLIDNIAPTAVRSLDNFIHTEFNPEWFNLFVEYLSVQKLRTPKGLSVLKSILKVKDSNELLFRVQELRALFCTTWSECIWSIGDASGSSVKFLLSDHPVTVFNQWGYPGSDWCRGIFDPDIQLVGTHTLFPISKEKIVILTNLSWVRNPYQEPIKPRPNPRFYDQTIASLLDIQVGRTFKESDVHKINFIIKQRAHRYIAAAKEDWLYPEEHVRDLGWSKLASDDFLMPDPRGVRFSTRIAFGNSSGSRFYSQDEYGRKPFQADFDNKSKRDSEWKTFHRYQGEYAKRHGPKRRGRSFFGHRLESAEDSPGMHQVHLSYLEEKR